MELKVWVEGELRVVSGLSASTSCQDVVIALAQSIGQTGRYVLILKLRGGERHLVAEDRPLQVLAQLEHLPADAHFVLQRTGPSLTVNPPTPSRERRYPGTPKSEPLRRRDQHKWLPSSQDPTLAQTGWSSPESRASPVGFLDSDASSKMEVFRQVLQQQKKLQDLEEELEALERETELWDQKVSYAVPGPTMDWTKELDHLEQEVRLNDGELMYNQHVDQELEEEVQREREMKTRLSHIHSSIDDQDQEIQATHNRAALLEQQIRAGGQSLPAQEAPQQSEEALRPLEQELVHRLQLAEDLDTALWASQRDLHAAEERVKDKAETIEELNKELRHYKLQQFIQQTSTGDPGNAYYLSNAGIKE